MTTKTNTTVLGEWGNGSQAWTVSVVRGHTAEVRRLWRELDSADGPRQRRIIDRLIAIGAAEEC